MVDIHTEVEIHVGGVYPSWDRLGQSLHSGYPRRGGYIWRSAYMLCGIGWERAFMLDILAKVETH